VGNYIGLKVGLFKVITIETCIINEYSYTSHKHIL